MDQYDAIPDELRERHAIPDDVMRLAEDVYQQGIYMTTEDTPQAIVRMLAKAIMAERNRAIEACEVQKAVFQSEQYAYPQPMGSFSECFAVDECIKAIRGDHQ